jgi:long-subunit acyl-CoA synthetase (AMP-forming)
MTNQKTQLDHLYDHEKAMADRNWFTQPVGGGQLREYTFAGAMNEARRMAAHLRALDLPEKSRIAIFSKNTCWWLMADIAIWMAGHVSVPIYPTLAATSIQQILQHSGAELVFVGKLDDFPSMAAGIPEGLTKIVMPLGPAISGAHVTKWEDAIAKHEPIADSPIPDPDSLATVIYTSGSTGEPKGVMHSFKTMCAAWKFAELAGMQASDRMISYLPLAHVAERALLETTNFKYGYHVFFAESLETFVEDVKRAQPTVFGSVPRLWLKFNSGVNAKMPPKKLAFLLKIPFVKSLIKKKVLDGLGLRQVRFAVTGSAPTPPELIAWYGALGLALHDVYGMTENFAVSHVVRPGEITPGRVGTPLPGVKCKISPEGEILVHSPGCMLGYFHAQTLTKEVVDGEGWIHTGDRGEIDAHDRLKITGRVKELFKTSKGKYVAPAPIENRLLAHAELEQACVSGANQGQPYAMVVLGEHIRKAGLTAEKREELTKILEGHLVALNRELDPHEHLEKLVVMKDEWTIENGMLTPTLKLKRSAIEARYAGDVEGWYGRRERVVWQ